MKAQINAKTSSDMDLSKMTWLVRDFEQSISTCKITNDSFLIGGWDGKLVRYSHDGRIEWQTAWDDRISDIEVTDSKIFATSGLHITCTCYLTGEKIWSKALEGSSDALVALHDKVHVVSSVYDIEHFDFLESALWTFSLDGEKLNVDRVDERPWSIIRNEDDVLLGMGRPKCGIARINNEMKIELLHSTESPITCGLSGRKNSLFGLANGSIVNDKNHEIYSHEGNSVEKLICVPEGFVASFESGLMVCCNADGGLLWGDSSSKIYTHSDGAHCKDNHHFTGFNDGQSDKISCRISDTGKEVASMQSSRLTCSDGDEKWVVFCTEDGKFYVWESELLERRLTQKVNQDTSESDLRKQALRDKLRKFSS